MILYSFCRKLKADYFGKEIIVLRQLFYPAIVKIVIFSVRPQKSNTIFVIIWKPLVVEQWFLYQYDCILMPNNIWQVTSRFNDTYFFQMVRILQSSRGVLTG